MNRSQPITMQLYCRIRVTVTDPDAVTDLAASQLREADIDWTQEEVDPDKMFDNVPGVEPRGGHVWAEIGEPRGDFLPGRA